MAVQPDLDTLRTFVTYQGQYHNHKEQLGYLASALYISGALWLLFNPEQWSGFPAWAKWLLVATGVGGWLYVLWQFHLRSVAADRIEWFIDRLGREVNWPEPPRGQLHRWTAPGVALVVMLFWGAAAFVRVVCGLWP